MKKVALSVFATMLCSLAFCAAAQAQVKFTFVSNAGSDANDCLSAATACRTFQHGHDVVSAGGVVVAINSGGFGTLVINKSVTITGEGVMAGIGATSGTAVSISTGSVSLIGLTINGNGSATVGIVVSGGTVDVQDCAINGFTTGVSASGTGKVNMVDSKVTNNSVGINANGTGSDGQAATTATVLVVLSGGSVSHNGTAFSQINAGVGKFNIWINIVSNTSGMWQTLVAGNGAMGDQPHDGQGAFNLH